MSEKKEPKFKSSFSTIIVKPLVSAEKDKYLSAASIEKLLPFLPNVDSATNYDLLPIAFNACVVNRVNKNDDVITSDTAVAIYKNFVNKPINVEHNRANIVGAILTAGFSKFGSDEPMTEEEARATNEPYNITLGGVIWRIANYDLADVIEQCDDPTSEHYLKISASWELGFDDYGLVVIDGDSKNTQDGIIVEDKGAIEKIEENLRRLGGSGKLGETKRVYSHIKGSGVLPMGIGLTSSPAADVTGILSAMTLDEEINASTELKNEMRAEILASLIKYSSQRQKQDVKKDSIIMKITSRKDITDESLKQISASAILDVIETELKSASEQWVQEKAEKDNAIKNAEEKYNTLANEHETLKKQFEALQLEVNKIKTESIAREKQEKFSARMEAFDVAFDLTEEDRKVIASQIKDLNDEAFTTTEANLKVLLSSKKKSVKATQQTVASTQDTNTQTIVDDALDKATKDKAAVVAATTPASQTMKDKYSKAFGIDGFEIQINNKR